MNTPAILEAIRNVRILVIGDVMLDHYIWGDVNRISPEAPVPVLHVMRESHSAGGRPTSPSTSPRWAARPR